MTEYKEWFDGRLVDEQMAKCMYWHRVAVEVICLLLVALLFFWPANASAEPIFRFTTSDHSVITLHDGKCRMPEVTNLPQVATWEEKGKTFAGCWGLNAFGIVMFYFSDKTVAGVPGPYFEKVVGT